ncbi:MAG: type VII toxin-antitoxin system HepT family RNase toxin [Desulfococcaceae bacterium]
MVSPQKVLKKFNLLEEYLRIVKQISQAPEEEFLKAKILIGSAKYYIQISIECCIDVATHIISSEGFRSPTEYADSFRVLMENGIFDKELTSRLVQMAKFRNRLVHLYGEIQDDFVYRAITIDLKDIIRFQERIKSHFP